jgi:hypothetical protein
MPSQKDHINKARHNEQFVLSLDIDTTPFLDWVVNGIFYSAIHYLDCYLSNQGKHPGDHGERIRLIWGERNLGKMFFRLYRPLKDDSEEGRYNMRVFLPEEIRKDILPLLNSIKIHLRTYIPEIKV